MRTRILPPEEWHRLEGEQLAPLIGPENSRVVVVEDDEGRIIANWSVMRVTYFESLNVVPEARGNLGVIRRLMAETFKAAQEFGSEWAFTGADDPQIAEYLVRLGGHSIPAMMFTVPLKGVH